MAKQNQTTRLAKQNQTMRRTRDRRGAVVVEMAIVLPIFLLILFGIIEFGRAMKADQILANGARLGARRAILDNQTNSGVGTLVKNSCEGILNTTVTVSISVNGVVNAPLATAIKGDECEVTVSVPFNQVSFLPSPTWLNGASLQSSCTMEHE